MGRSTKPPTWKLRNGTTVLLSNMDDSHLANAIRMVARNCHRNSYLGVMTRDKTFIKLTSEAKKRHFTISILNTPITKDNRTEYVEVLIPNPPSQLAAGFFSTDWDSRLEE